MDAEARKAGLDRMRGHVATLVPLLRLSHWEIGVDDEPPESEGEAAIWYSRKCYVARIRFADKHFAQPVAEQATTVAHELLHLHLSGPDWAAKDAADMLDPTSKLWVQERWDVEFERAVDAISRVLAPFLPLPPVEASKESV
jgi:hypothetical protein